MTVRGCVSVRRWRRTRECVIWADCLQEGGGSRELEAAVALGMRAVQAAWYFREDIFYPSVRMERFKQMTPLLDVMKEV